MLETKEIGNYKNYGRVLSISNGVIEAYVTIDVGPRIIRFGYIGEDNIMNDDTNNFPPLTDATFENFFGKGKMWNNYGGHRIWLSPESYPETYYPDCEKVDYQVTTTGAIFTPKAQKENEITQQLKIKMDSDDANMQVVMNVKNICDKPLDFAIGGLTVSAKGGTLIIPMNDNDTGLLANRTISIWPYTDMGDKRIHWGDKYVTVKQDPNSGRALKLGFDLRCGTTYYVVGDNIFCKSFETNHPDGVYPDNGCSMETYTNSGFIEIESLSELKTVAPGETIISTESWALCKKPCNVTFTDDASIENLLSKI